MVNTGQGTGKKEEAEAKCHGGGDGKPAHSGLYLQQLWGLTVRDLGTDRTRCLAGEMCVLAYGSSVFPFLGHWQSFGFKVV